MGYVVYQFESFPVQLSFLTLLVCSGMEPRPHCTWRKVGTIVPLLAVYDLVVWKLAPHTPGLQVLERPALLLPVFYLVICVRVWYRCKWEEGAFCVIAAAIAQNIVYNLYWLVKSQLRFSSGSLTSLLVTIGWMAVIAAFTYLVLNRRLMVDKRVSINKVKLCICSFTVLSTTAFFSPRLMGVAGQLYVYLCYVLMDILALMFQFGMLYEGGLEQKNAIMEQLLYAEQKNTR